MSTRDGFELVVRGDLVLPDRVLERGLLAILDGRIAAVLAPDADPPPAERMLDASGLLVLPGLVDTHVHTLSAASEGIRRATAAAARGGVTTIVDMPYDAGAPIVDAGRLAGKIAAVEAEAHVDVGLYGTIAKVDGVRELPALVEAGVLAVKVSLFETDPRRFPRILDGDLEAAFALLAPTGVPVVVHAELQEVIERRLGELDPALADAAGAHAATRPVVSETAAIAKALELALWTGTRLHVAHVTHPHGFRQIGWYRSLGARVSGETCVHYLALTDDDLREHGPLAKVNPPLRDSAAREELWAALGRGEIESISTDHAPWPAELKTRAMLDAASGMPGLETFLAVLHTEAMARGFPLPQLVDAVATRPAELFGLAGRKGRLAVGYDADLAVLAPGERWQFDPETSLTSARWSPFAGRELVGRVVATYVRGTPVWEDGDLATEPGFGRWLRREPLVAPAKARGR